MRIHVKSSDRSVYIPVPTGLIFGRVPVWLWLKLGKLTSKSWSRDLPESAEMKISLLPEELPEKAVYALCAEIMRIKRQYGSWKLVEVQSADGDEVLIEL